MSRIGLIVSSVREPRINPEIAKWVQGVVAEGDAGAQLVPIDLLDHPLPLRSRGKLPADLPKPLPPSPYADEATNAWSAVVASCDAFIITTPQYNWSFPASLKLAFDAIFHEWGGKPVGIVSYGNRGGNLSADAVAQVVRGVHAELVGRVELPFRAVEGALQESAKFGKPIDGLFDAWEKAGKADELVKLHGAVAEASKKRLEAMDKSG